VPSLPPEEGENRKLGGRKKTGSRSKEKTKQKPLLCYVFGCFAGYHRRRKEEKKKAGQIYPFPGVACGGA